jgi:hypothetical protein
MAKKLRPLGHTLLDLEKLLLEMAVDHDLQWGDILNLVRGYLEVHCPNSQEEYDDGDSPEFYYGPRQVKNNDGRSE